MHQVTHLPTFSLLFPITAPLEVILAHFAREAKEAQRRDVLCIFRYMVREVPLSEFILRTIVLNHDKMLCDPCQKNWLRKAACDRISTLPSSTFIEQLAWQHDCPAKDYISQVPLQLGKPM